FQGGSQMRAFSNGCVLAVMFVAACGMAAPVRAQTDVERPLVNASAAPSSNMPAFRTALFTPTVDFDQVIQQPAGPPPTPRHTGIKALVKGLIIDFKYLPSRENLMWAGVGGGLALAVHPADDDVNHALVGNDFAETFAFATALDRHMGWRYAVPAYTFASYVAISRLPANRHWLSDAVFGSTVGIIAGRTITSHEAHPFPVAVNYIPGGVAAQFVYRSKSVASTACARLRRSPIR